MKTIGLIGGMSWESTAEYYRLANELVRERLGGLHSAKALLHSVDFADIQEMQKTDRWQDAGRQLADAARSLEYSGADMVLICTNTMHIVAEQVQDAISIPLLDIRDVTANAVLHVNMNRVGLLATAYTMEQPFYRERLARRNIEIVIPETDDRATVNRIIFDELCCGIMSDASRKATRAIIVNLAQRGCQGIILGCTELELLVSQDDSEVPLFASTRLHVEAAMRSALA